MTLLADLRLRFGSTRLPARVYLPAPSAVPAAGAPLVLWLTGRGARDLLCQDLSAAAAAVVIELGCREGGCGAGYEIDALGWATEHAPELGASSGPVAVAGQLAGAARAARLAVDAHESGWPVVRTQVLVRPAFSDLCRAARDRTTDAGTRLRCGAPASMCESSSATPGGGYRSTNWRERCNDGDIRCPTGSPSRI